MTKSTKPETPAYNWAVIENKTNRIHNQLFDTRREARNWLDLCAGLVVRKPTTHRIVRVSIKEIKRGKP